MKGWKERREEERREGSRERRRRGGKEVESIREKVRGEEEKGSRVIEKGGVTESEGEGRWEREEE